MPFGNLKSFRVKKGGFVVKSKTMTVQRLNKKVNKLASKVKPEIKHVAYEDGFTIPLDEAKLENNLHQICLIDQGIENDERVGNRVKYTGISGKMLIRNTDTTTQNSPNTVAIWVIIDNRSNQMDLRDIVNLSDFNDPHAVTGAHLDPYSLRNEDFRARFKVVYHKVFTLGGASITRTSTEKMRIQYLTFNKRFKTPIIAQYVAGDATGAFDAMARGTVWLLTRANGGSSIGPSWDGAIRLYYTDA